MVLKIIASFSGRINKEIMEVVLRVLKWRVMGDFVERLFSAESI